MKNAGIIYLEDYKQDEQKLLEKNGISTFRVPNTKDISSNLNLPFRQYLLRGKRLNFTEYERVYTSLNVQGYVGINTPSDYELNASFDLHYKKIKAHSPKSLFFSKEESLSEIFSKLREANLSIPLFVRTDKESAAKYVGIEGCLIRELNPNAIDKCLENISENISEYRLLIFKEVHEISKSLSRRKEYRAIFINGIYISFDYEKELPNPNSFGMEQFAVNLANELAALGMKGAFFIDLAETVTGEKIIVECKDFLNGTINDLDSFAIAFAKKIDSDGK